MSGRERGNRGGVHRPFVKVKIFSKVRKRQLQTCNCSQRQQKLPCLPLQSKGILD